MHMEIPLTTKTAVKDNQETKNIVIQSEEELPFLKQKDKRVEKAEFFKALGDETRLRIIGMLAIDDLCMCEIISGLNIPSSTVSHHLKLLERGSVIESRKEGRFTVYRLQKEKVLPYLKLELKKEGKYDGGIFMVE